jgi:hypothetical protein
MIGRVPGRCRPSPPALAAVLIAVVLGGCGSGGSSPVISGSAASQMRGHLAELRTAAAGHDPAGAARQLDAFAADVAREHAAGRLRAADYAALETAIVRTRARIAAEVTAPVPAAPVTVQATTAPAAPAAPVFAGTGKGHAKDQAKAQGKGKGKGKG